jgi:hypothetical protein
LARCFFWFQRVRQPLIEEHTCQMLLESNVVTADMVDDAHRLLTIDLGANGHGQWGAAPQRRDFCSF